MTAPADPIFALIAEYRRLIELWGKSEDESGRAYFAIREKAPSKRGAFSMETAALFASDEGRRWFDLYTKFKNVEAQLHEAFDRVGKTKVTTIAGIIAQIQFLVSEDAWDEEACEIVVAGLRGIEAALAGTEAGRLEPEVIGFGAPDERP